MNKDYLQQWLFITFEGIDGSGKTTQAKLLAEHLKENGFDVVETKEPGAGKLGQQIREILLNPNNDICAQSEIMLFLADRIQHIETIILPALRAGKIVICDRYHDSTLAYQGGGRNISLVWMESIEARFILTPNITFWLDIPVEESQKRLAKKDKCRFEQEGLEFYKKVREEYLYLYSGNEKIVRVDAMKDKDTIHEYIVNTLNTKEV